jgi:molybdopterin synthase sulfur carrier subunit
VTVIVRLPSVLAEVSGGAREVELDAGSVGDVLSALAAQHPLLGRRLRDETGAIRRYVNVYVDGEDVRATGGLETPVADGAVLEVLPSVAGGAISSAIAAS